MSESDKLARAFAVAASSELDDALQKIGHCLEQLDHDQVWARQSAELNSMANLLLHLAGNLRQWIISGLGGTPDVRQRQSEFDDRGGAAKEELFRRLEETVAEARDVLAELSPQEWLRARRIQGFEVSGAQATMHSVAHFRGHTQEIVYMTRCALGEGYEFDFVPNSEQA